MPDDSSPLPVVGTADVGFGPESSSLLLRYFFAPDADLPLDSHGLLVDELAELARTSGTAFRLDDLISQRFALLIGPPHSGKSFGIERLRTWLAWRGSGPTLLHTDIKTIGILQPSIFPLNWDSWRNSRDNAIWCIDALDETSQRPKAPLAIAEALKRLSTSERSRINLLVTCRENELPPRFGESIQELLGCECRTLRIAAPSRQVAEEICGGPAKLARVLATIQSSSLQDLAEHPAALKWLAQRGETERETRAGVWQGVIGELLDQPFLGEAPALSRHDERFLAAARIAFMLEFGDFDEIRLTGSSRDGLSPSLESLFQSSEERELDAARDAVRSALFQRLGGHIRIRNRHLREWLASWQLRELAEPDRWEQIRELLGGNDLSDASGNSLTHLLLEVVSEGGKGSHSPDLVTWLEERQTLYVENLLGALLKAAADASTSIASGELIKRIVRLAPKMVFDVALRSHATRWAALSPASKDLAFWIAEALPSRGLVEVAKSTLADSTENENARIAALRYLGTLKESLDLLEVAKKLSSTERDRSARLLGNVLSVGLHTGTIGVQDALLLAPRRTVGVVDARAMLEYDIAERLTVEAALSILEQPTRYDSDSHLVEKAIELLTTSLPMEHAGRIAKAIRGAAKAKQFDALDNWDRVLMRAPTMRRTLYAEWIESGESFDLDHHLSLSLQTDDVPFLLEILEKLPTVSERLVTDIFRLTRSTTNAAPTLARLRARAGTIVAQIEASISKSEREMEAIRAKYARKKPERISLESALGEALATRTAPRERLQTIGWLAFGDTGLRPSNLDGTFDTLPESLQRTLLDELKELVTSTPPSDIPKGNTIPGSVLTEGAAVEEAFRRFGGQSFDEPTIVKWFPTLLRLLENDDVINELSRTHPRVAVTAFQAWIEREMSEDSGTLFGAIRAPSKLWGDGLAEMAATLLQRPDLPARSRAVLLSELAKHGPEFALTTAEAWTAETDNPVLRTSAIKALLRLTPGAGVNALKNEVAARGRQALLDVAGVFDTFGERGVPVSSFTEADQANLLRLLFEHFPEGENDRRPPGEAHIIDDEDHLIELRRRLVARAIEANTAESDAVLNEIAKSAPRLRLWLQQRAAEKNAQDVLDGTPPSPPPAGAPGGNGQPAPRRKGLPLPKLLSILRFREYRLARTAADLFRVIREVLVQIETDLADDLIIFFPNGWDEHHAREDVLQGYLCRRLNDLMPGRVVDREAWMRLNRRADLRARVQYADLGTTCEVPIEIKWSDDSRTPTAAGDQLGANYMQNSARTHGLYVVGWCGKSAPVALGEQGLKAAIATSASDFVLKNPGFHIEVVWLRIDAVTLRTTSPVSWRRVELS